MRQPVRKRSRRPVNRQGAFATIRQLETEYGIPYLRIWEWCRSGQLPYLDDGTRTYAIRRTDFKAFIDAHMTKAR